jgi:hypothetical protein
MNGSTINHPPRVSMESHIGFIMLSSNSQGQWTMWSLVKARRHMTVSGHACLLCKREHRRLGGEAASRYTRTHLSYILRTRLLHDVKSCNVAK